MNKKILMLIAPNNFRDEELLVPKRIFEANKDKVFVASENVIQSRGMLGAVSKIDIDVAKVNVADYDAIIFVGGVGIESNKIYENKKYLNIAKEASYRGKVLAAICLGVMVLASAGLLVRKRATCFRSAIDYITEKGAIYTPKPVVQDGKIITAEGPDAAKEFGETIKKNLG